MMGIQRCHDYYPREFLPHGEKHSKFGRSVIITQYFSLGTLMQILTEQSYMHSDHEGAGSNNENKIKFINILPT